MTPLPQTPPQTSQDIHAQIVMALKSLDYTPVSGIQNAAMRMSRAPELVQVMFIYLKAGKPAINYNANTPTNLFMTLPGGYSVASLIRDFGLAPVGAFLMASEIIADTPSAQRMLITIIEEGYIKILPNGTRMIICPPVAYQYPSCPNCGRRWVRNYPSCPTCGYGEMERQLDKNEIPDQILVEYLNEINASPPTSSLTHQAVLQGQRVCPSCGVPIASGKTFCTGCGAHIVSAPVQQPKKFCGSCGTEIQPNKNFCPQCGAKTD